MDILNTSSSGQFEKSTASISCYDNHFLLFILIGIFSLTGAPISAQTLHCPEFAVVDYSFIQGSLFATPLGIPLFKSMGWVGRSNLDACIIQGC